jgi:hypothetical protein
MNTFTSNADEGADHPGNFFQDEFFHDAFGYSDGMGPSPEPFNPSILASNDVHDQSTLIGKALPSGDDSLERPLEGNRSLASLRPGSSSDSSIQYQCHDSSASASATPSSGLLGSDRMMVDERQAADWNAQEQLLVKKLLPLAHRDSLARQPQFMGKMDTVCQEGNFAIPSMGQFAYPVASSNLPASTQTPLKSRCTSLAMTSDLPLSNQKPPMSQAASATPILGYSVPTLYQPGLSIGRILEKSRVETQIPILLTLHHMPQGINRIHFPPSCISKPKLLTRPPPSKSPDMLELQVSLVCTSAMQDAAKRKEALAREAGPQEYVEECNPGEDKKPSHGGRVYSCAKCIKREQKRANRKKVKNIEEEEAWQREETKRIIVFNTEEVGSLLDLSAAPGAVKYAEATGSTPGPSQRGFSALPTSVSIELHMRITCYCRHHDEKSGFQ